MVINLTAEGFHVEHVNCGEKAIEAFHRIKPLSAIILDIMLPNRDGFSIAEYIRNIDPKIGILMVTARAGDEDRIRGLALGVDDYITKPFHLKELLFRIKRVADRSAFFAATNEDSNSTYTLGGLTLDTKNLKLTLRGKKSSLTALEADVMKEFMLHPDQVLSREHLLQKVWNVSQQIETRTVDIFIARLRKLIEENPKNPIVLQSVRGRGYKMTTP